jgi:hypothetical protein
VDGWNVGLSGALCTGSERGRFLCDNSHLARSQAETAREAAAAVGAGLESAQPETGPEG